MKSKTIILLGIAVVCGLVASFMTQRILADRNQPTEEDQEKVKILVAKSQIPQGTLIDNTDKYFKEKLVSKDDVPKGAIDNAEKLKNRRVNRLLPEDGHITDADLMDMKMADLVYKLHPGMRAITIRVTAESQVSGFIMPSMRVDVVWTTSGGEGKTAKTILQNMLVIAVDTSDERDPSRKTQQGGNVTLEASMEEALSLIAAQASGDLRLLLRQADDKTKLKTREVTQAQVAKGGAQESEQEDDQTAPGFNPGGSKGTLPQGSAKKPEIPIVPEAPKVVEKAPEAPKVVEKAPEPPVKEPDIWVMRITNGNQTVHEKYLIGEDGKVIDAGGLHKPAAPQPSTQDKPETPKTATIEPEAAKPEAAKPEAAKPEAPRVEATKPEAATPDARKSATPKPVVGPVQ